MAGDIHCQFQSAPDPQFIEGVAQVIFDYLLAGTHQVADLAVGKAFPDPGRHLNFFRGKPLARGHELSSCLSKAAVARRTRLRPSRIPARRNRVRRCCLTVRGLILNWPAISLLLQPCTSRSRTCRSRGVTFTLARLITMMFLPSLPWGDSCRASFHRELKQLFRQTFSRAFAKLSHASTPSKDCT